MFVEEERGWDLYILVGLGGCGGKVDWLICFWFVFIWCCLFKINVGFDCKDIRIFLFVIVDCWVMFIMCYWEVIRGC